MHGGVFAAVVLATFILGVFRDTPRAVLAAPVVGGPDCRYAREFDAFAAKYRRHYASWDEMATRCFIFSANYQAVVNHNAQPRRSYTATIDRPLADYTKKERLTMRPTGRLPASTWISGARADRIANPHRDGAAPLPRVNHWDESKVTNVKDQGQYGNCWAEAATEVVESLINKQHPMELLALSVQQVSDCVGNGDSCNGGYSVDGLRYAKKMGGLVPEANYSYVGCGVCNQKLVNSSTFPIAFGDVVAVPTMNETMLWRVATTNTVAVAIDASGQGFYFYAYGVYDGTFNNQSDCCSDYDCLDHEVLLHGYDADYYLIQNSWGLEWSNMDGHILFKRGQNTCGVATDACFVSQ